MKITLIFNKIIKFLGMPQTYTIIGLLLICIAPFADILNLDLRSNFFAKYAFFLFIIVAGIYTFERISQKYKKKIIFLLVLLNKLKSKYAK